MSETRRLRKRYKHNWAQFFHNRMLVFKSILTTIQRNKLVEQLAWFLKQLPAPPLEENVRKTATGMYNYLETVTMDPENSLIGLQPSHSVLTAVGVEKSERLLQAFLRSEPLSKRRGFKSSARVTATEESQFLQKSCVVIVPFQNNVGNAAGKYVYGRLAAPILGPTVDVYVQPDQWTVASIPCELVFPLPPSARTALGTRSMSTLVSDPAEPFIESLRDEVESRTNRFLKRHGVSVNRINKVLSNVHIRHFSELRRWKDAFRLLQPSPEQKDRADRGTPGSSVSPSASNLVELTVDVDSATGSSVGDLPLTPICLAADLVNQEATVEDEEACVDNTHRLADEFLSDLAQFLTEHQNRFLENFRSNNIYYPARDDIISQIYNCVYIFCKFSRALLLQQSCMVDMALEEIERQIHGILDGTIKSELSDWWLGIIDERMVTWLEASSVNVHAIPYDYINEPPKDLRPIREMYHFVEKNLSQVDLEGSEIKRLIDSLREKITPRICDFIEKASGVLSLYLSVNKTSGTPILQDMSFYRERLREQQQSLSAKLVDQLGDLIKDVEYLQEMLYLEDHPVSSDGLVLGVVPISGIIVGRLFRLENEVVTVLQVWGHEEDQEMLERKQDLKRARMDQKKRAAAELQHDSLKATQSEPILNSSLDADPVVVKLEEPSLAAAHVPPPQKPLPKPPQRRFVDAGVLSRSEGESPSSPPSSPVPAAFAELHRVSSVSRLATMSSLDRKAHILRLRKQKTMYRSLSKTPETFSRLRHTDQSISQLRSVAAVELFSSISDLQDLANDDSIAVHLNFLDPAQESPSDASAADPSEPNSSSEFSDLASNALSFADPLSGKQDLLAAARCSPPTTRQVSAGAATDQLIIPSPMPVSSNTASEHRLHPVFPSQPSPFKPSLPQPADTLLAPYSSISKLLYYITLRSGASMSPPLGCPTVDANFLAESGSSRMIERTDAAGIVFETAVVRNSAEDDAARIAAEQQEAAAEQEEADRVAAEQEAALKIAAEQQEEAARIAARQDSTETDSSIFTAEQAAGRIARDEDLRSLALPVPPILRSGTRAGLVRSPSAIEQTVGRGRRDVTDQAGNADAGDVKARDATPSSESVLPQGPMEIAPAFDSLNLNPQGSSSLSWVIGTLAIAASAVLYAWFVSR